MHRIPCHVYRKFKPCFQVVIFSLEMIIEKLAVLLSISLAVAKNWILPYLSSLWAGLLDGYTGLPMFACQALCYYFKSK